MFCKHEWKIKSVAYTDPYEVTNAKGQYALQWVQEMIQGTTHIGLCCTKCGDIKEKQLSGIHKIDIDKESR